MTSPPTSASTGRALEADLSLLLAALHSNNSDEWEGKPQQCNFRMYEPLTSAPPAAQASIPASPPTSHHTKVEGTQPAKALPNDSGSSTATGDRNSDDAAPSSLDALMGEYMQALRGLRAAEASTTTVAGESSKTKPVHVHEQTASSRDEQAGSSPAHAPDAEADLQSLLDALDHLPPLTRD